MNLIVENTYFDKSSYSNIDSSEEDSSDEEQEFSLFEYFIESIKQTKPELVEVYKFLKTIIINQTISPAIKEAVIQLVVSKLIYNEPIYPSKAAQVTTDLKLYEQFIDLNMYEETYHVCYNILRPNSDIDLVITFLILILDDEAMKPVYKNTISQIMIYRMIYGEVITPFELERANLDQENNSSNKSDLDAQVYESVYNSLVSLLEDNNYSNAEITLIKLSEENS